MYETHRLAAEQHEMASRAHRTAAEHNERGDNPTGNWHTERAMEHADDAHKFAAEAHDRSGRIENL